MPSGRSPATWVEASRRILADLENPAFLEALRSKGRFWAVLSQVPVHVILNSKVGLLGAVARGLEIRGRARVTA